jgi:CRISPR-associated protein Cmr3
LAEGGLYATAHARPDGKVSLAVEIEGLPAVDLGRIAPLGGEARGVWIKRRGGDIQLPEAPRLASDSDGVLRYTVTLITPGDLGDEWPAAGGRLSAGDAALPGHVVAACTGRAVMVGGWDNEARAPLPLHPLVPAGSVWFLEAKAGDTEAAAQWHGRAIGRATGWGFGCVLIGRWQPAEEET